MTDLEKRIVSLEEKYSHQDDLVSKLNQIVAEQDQTINILIQQVQSLSAIASSANSSSGGVNLSDEIPPHY